jgi:hypothetical protein
MPHSQRCVQLRIDKILVDHGSVGRAGGEELKADLRRHVEERCRAGDA